ncbi:Gfo/Idh/MocA family protein [Saccharibacillus alkalitolerans]|uniref:Gfo/Idh/MocA family oxidoreductase n=1 Tax=Saccharibacillus alkalitolerans TaxID=2705290 RepID=A0ABX0FDQ1_9BACL|nr:Gfo/Idh/MocA family oxidoreductase [Saccharibacillus alkalitolerans]NGZ76497.1 Gfo/Idh/MocA family oxidoreductase [Saccharibacillus alkalitolerans]
MGKIKLAVIGLGNMGRHMIRSLVPQYADRVELVALCDSREDVLRSESEAAGGAAAPSLYTDYRELLAETDADLVYIAVPPSMHFDAARLAFARGIHVFCEKPLANSLEEAQEMVKLAQRAEGLLNVVHFSFPLEAPVLEFRRRVERGDAGDIRSIDLYLEFPQWPRAWQQNDWISTRREGGYLLEVGVHWIQMIQQTFGPIVAVRSEIEFPEDENLCEKTVRGSLRLESGSEIRVTGSDRREGGERVSLVVQGSGGTVALENWGSLFAGPAGEEPRPIEVPEEDGELPIFGQVLNRLEGKPGTAYDFRDGYNAQVVLEALRNPAEGWTDLKERLISAEV